MSTCRFAQRVALIKNEAILNEELDPKLMIARLKRQIQQLKDELAMATGEQRTDALSAEDLERRVEAFDNIIIINQNFSSTEKLYKYKYEQWKKHNFGEW